MFPNHLVINKNVLDNVPLYLLYYAIYTIPLQGVLSTVKSSDFLAPK